MHMYLLQLWIECNCDSGGGYSSVVGPPLILWSVSVEEVTILVKEVLIVEKEYCKKSGRKILFSVTAEENINIISRIIQTKIFVVLMRIFE